IERNRGRSVGSPRACARAVRSRSRKPTAIGAKRTILPSVTAPAYVPASAGLRTAGARTASMLVSAAYASSTTAASAKNRVSDGPDAIGELRRQLAQVILASGTA